MQVKTYEENTPNRAKTTDFKGPIGAVLNQRGLEGFKPSFLTRVSNPTAAGLKPD